MDRTIGSRLAGEIIFIGCCGAYCKTCRALILGHCNGCKLGYDDGKRSIAKARCKIKLCCLGDKKLETCADCPEYEECGVLAAFHNKNAREYKMYRESLEYIRAHGYMEFVKRGKDWKRACGKL